MISFKFGVESSTHCSSLHIMTEAGALDCAPPLLKQEFVCSFRKTGQESPPPSLSLSGCVRRSRLNKGNVSAQRPALANIDAICMRFGRQAYNIISGRILIIQRMILMYFSHRLLNNNLRCFGFFGILGVYNSPKRHHFMQSEGEKKRKRPTLQLFRQLLRKDY